MLLQLLLLLLVVVVVVVVILRGCGTAGAPRVDVTKPDPLSDRLLSATTTTLGLSLAPAIVASSSPRQPYYVTARRDDSAAGRRCATNVITLITPMSSENRQ